MNPSNRYAFVELAEEHQARSAIEFLNGRKVFDCHLRVNWATGGTKQLGADPVQQQFQLFVGDLAPEVARTMTRR